MAFTIRPLLLQARYTVSRETVYRLDLKVVLPRIFKFFFYNFFFYNFFFYNFFNFFFYLTVLNFSRKKHFYITKNLFLLNNSIKNLFLEFGFLSKTKNLFLLNRFVRLFLFYLPRNLIKFLLGFIRTYLIFLIKNYVIGVDDRLRGKLA